MVGLQAMVLGRLGWTPPLIQERVLYPAHRHLRAGAMRKFREFDFYEVG